jgi:hypothetical protein
MSLREVNTANGGMQIKRNLISQERSYFSQGAGIPSRRVPEKVKSHTTAIFKKVKPG